MNSGQKQFPKFGGGGAGAATEGEAHTGRAGTELCLAGHPHVDTQRLGTEAGRRA